MFIRKRDPRYKSHLAHQTKLAAIASSSKPSASNSGMTTPRRSAPIPTSYVEQDWQKAGDHIQGADLEWAVAEGTEDPEVFECVACGKTFKSEAAWDSHERSKKHLKAVEMLKQEMEQDAEELELEEDIDGDVAELEEPPRSP